MGILVMEWLLLTTGWPTGPTGSSFPKVSSTLLCPLQWLLVNQVNQEALHTNKCAKPTSHSQKNSSQTTQQRDTSTILVTLSPLTSTGNSKMQVLHLKSSTEPSVTLLAQTSK